MNEYQDILGDLESQFSQLKVKLNINDLEQKLKNLEALTIDPVFWCDEKQAKTVMRQISSIQETIHLIDTFSSQLKSLNELTSLIDTNTPSDTQKQLETEIKKLNKDFQQLKIRSCLNGPFDSSPAILSIHSGQGGTEAMDWASMLLRMYQRYFELKKWSFELVEHNVGEEAGIKTATLIVNAPFAYGYLKAESGTHRLVRQSPFNADNLRQTSFAAVEIMPVFETNQSIQVKDEDLEWQFFRSGGKGGQNVNKVNTAVRLTHLPTQIVVTCSSQRHQEQNRKIALQLLESKLWQRQQASQEEQHKVLKGEYKPAAWGQQIRSYVLHPYHLVKDLRTQAETHNTEAVLNGDIDLFIQAYLLGSQKK